MMRETRGLGRGMWAAVATLALGGCGDGSSEMDVVVVDNGTISEGPITVGEGLAFELDLRVDDGFDSFEAPTDLEVVPENSGDLLVEVVGTVPATTGEATRVRLTPLVPGPGSVRFFADNAVEDPTFHYDALTVDDAEITATVQGHPESETTGAEMTVFAGSRVLFSAVYRAGGQRVIGRERFEVESTTDSSFLDSGDDAQQMLDVAGIPHDAVVSSPSSGTVMTIHAVDATGIWLTELEVNGAAFTSEEPFALAVGEQVRVDLVPSSRQGARIWGVAATQAEWELRGTSIAETSRDADGGYFEGMAAGETTILFTYGEAQAALVVGVSP